MRRAKPQPTATRSISPTRSDPGLDQRLGITADDLSAFEGKSAHSIAAVSKEIDLRKAPAPSRLRRFQIHLPLFSFPRLQPW